MDIARDLASAASGAPPPPLFYRAIRDRHVPSGDNNAAALVGIVAIVCACALALALR